MAGGGIAGAATALRLLAIGFGVRLLVRRNPVTTGIEALPTRALGLLEVLGEPQLVTDAGGVTVAAGEAAMPVVHVERRALARAFLDRARTRGAVVVETPRLPPASEVDAPAVVDATGRAAAWSRPLVVDGHDVAWQFEGPPQADGALRMVQGERWWAYRLGTPASTWVGVILDGRAGGTDQRVATAEALLRLGLDADAMMPRGRRAARVQRAVRPVDGRRIAVGDAALAHDPVAGAGIRFALASSIAAATTVSTWVADAGDHDLAGSYYSDLVIGEHGRHLAARGSVHTAESRTGAAPVRPQGGPVPDTVRFGAAIVETPLAIDGDIRPGAAVRLPDGTLSRWLGSFDLLVLARLASNPVPRLVLLVRLQQAGLGVEAARAVVSWALGHGLLTGCGAVSDDEHQPGQGDLRP